MGRLLFVVLAVLASSVGLVVASGPAAACSCVQADTGHFLRNADAVFAGTVLDVDDDREYEVAVDTVYLGEVDARVEVLSPEASTCALEGVEEDGDYVFFADVVGAELHADLCGGTAPAADDLRADVAERTGRADKPEPGPVDHADWPGWLLPAGGALIGVALVAGLLSRRRT